MENVEQHLENATPTTLLHYQLSDTWRSPRGTVLRIEGLALVAITCSFFLVAFGSCRRWSNRWIIQKGFSAAQVLSLSLGTYSIGLMQSSPVKSEMYPIWAVSLFTLLGCVDPVTTYIGLEYKGPLLKMIFQLCLYCGYVLLMSFSTISGVVGKLAIGLLSAITFIKGCHMSLAFVLPSSTRDKLAEFNNTEPSSLAGEGEGLPVQLLERWYTGTSMSDIRSSCNQMVGKLKLKEVTANGIEDVCLGYSLSHLLQRCFLGMDTSREIELKFEKFARVGRAIDYKKTLKAIEIELAFLYEVFFTSNQFLHYDEAKNSSFWALASFVGICFVGVATAIPGAMSSRHHITSNSPGVGTIIVNTTRADLIITLVILVSLALLQLVQLIRCWTSNWARVAFACEYARRRKKQEDARKRKKQEDARKRKKQASEQAAATADPESCGQISSNSKEKQISWWMRLKAFVVTKMNWFDKYLWQDQLGQYSILGEAASSRRESQQGCPQVCLVLRALLMETRCGLACFDWTCHRLPRMLGLYWASLLGSSSRHALWFRRIGSRLAWMLGLQYIGRVLRELFAHDTSTAVRLHDDVKASIADFLGKIKSRRIGAEWSSLFVANGLDLSFLPYSTAPLQLRGVTKLDAYAFSHRVMIWHVATCYCELADPQEGSAGAGGSGGGTNDTRESNRRVAMELSRYCAYLVVSAPELLPGPSVEIKSAHKEAMDNTGNFRRWGGTLLEWMRERSYPAAEFDAFRKGAYWGMRLLNETRPPGCTPRRRSDDHWEVLALLWVQTLLYAEPYGDVQRHMQHLSQGGEFITHLWALLYHMGIDRWDREPAQAAAAVQTREAEAAAGETREAAEVQGDAGEAEIQEIN